MRESVLASLVMVVVGLESAAGGEIFAAAGPSFDKPEAQAKEGIPSLVPQACRCDQCAAGPRFWIRAEELLWWIKDGPSSFPLLTTGPPESAGVPGRPGVVVLFGGSDFDFGTFNGLGLAAGVDDPVSGFGVMARSFLLEHRATRFAAAASRAGEPLLASPIVSPTTGELTTSIANNRNLVTTGFAGAATSRLWGSEADLVGPGWTNGCAAVRPLVGFRYLDLFEQLDVTNNLFSVMGGGNIPTGSTVGQVEGFHTRSQFYGGQVGAQGEVRRGEFFVNLLGTVALGVSHDVVSVAGFETITTPTGRSFSEASALFAMPTNNGRRGRDVFAVVPEMRADVGYSITPNVRVSVGYTFLYWSDVVRPADQIDPVVNTRFRFGIGPPRPAPRFEHTDFWAHGVNFALAVRY